MGGGSSTQNLEDLEKSIALGKSQLKMKIGYYRVSSERKNARYVFIPSQILRQKTFTFDDVFHALGIDNPNLIFQICSAPDVIDWNLRLPSYKTSLIGTRHPNPKDEVNGLNGPLRHYQGVVRENCKRLLRGTATACTQAGAVFRIEEVFDDEEPNDAVAAWLSEGSQVPMLGVACLDDFCDEVKEQFLKNMCPFNPSSEDDDEAMSKLFKIDIEPWLSGAKKPARDDKTEKVSSSIPHQKITHLIISDDSALLEDKLEKAIPTGLIVVHGDEVAAADFSDSIQKGQPIFLFKYTGCAADLACEMLSKVDSFLHKRRINPSVRPDHPFKTNLPNEGYSHPRWLWPFDEHHVDVCRQMNILIENFPDRYNPASVLQIDMFNTSEEKLQDQLTKTMSVVFEGIVELGGQSAENRRITYAWRLRHLLAYNAAREQIKSDTLQFLITLLTLLSTVAAVFHTYVTSIDTTRVNFEEGSTGREVLLKLTLLLPLATTVLRGINATLNPVAKQAVLKFAAIRVESEIYMYRTKVGRYNARKNSAISQTVQNKNSDKSGGGGSGNSSNKKNKKGDDEKTAHISNPRKVFSNAMDLIWNELAASDIRKGALVNPPEGTDPLDDINERIRSNIRTQNLLTQALNEPKQKMKSMNQKQTTIEMSNIGNNNDTAVVLKKAEIVQADSLDTEKDEELLNDEATSVAETLREDVESQGDVEQGIKQSYNHKEKVVAKEFAEILEDDGLSTITADEYVKLRLNPIIASFTAKAPKFALHSNTASVIVIALSILSAVLTVFSLTVFIPIALAISAAISAWVSFKQTDMRLMQTNGAIHQLHQLLIWWDSLNMIEKRVATNKEFLVQTTESAVQGQVVNAVSSGSNDDDVDDEL